MNNGGPAFPRPIGNNGRPNFEDSEMNYGQVGMSLRDWFAGKALHGILAAQAHPSSPGTIPVDNDGAAFVALNALRYADAMLAALDKAEGL